MLRPVVLPQDVGISLQSSASGIEEALAKITDDLENEISHLVVGFDAEWNVDFKERGSIQPTAIIPNCLWKVGSYIPGTATQNLIHWKASTYCILQISQFKGNLPSMLKSFLQNPQILKAGRNVNQDLKRLERECKSLIPFVGAIELATLAKARGAISDAQLGLADICAAVLHCAWTNPVHFELEQIGIIMSYLLSSFNMQPWTLGCLSKFISILLRFPHLKQSQSQHFLVHKYQFYKMMVKLLPMVFCLWKLQLQHAEELIILHHEHLSLSNTSLYQQLFFHCMKYL
jgi:hypothetical protein